MKKERGSEKEREQVGKMSKKLTFCAKQTKRKKGVVDDERKRERERDREIVSE